LDLTNNSETDTESYVLIARQLLDGEEGYFRLRTPGYPIFLALTGLDLRLALLVQGLLGFATCGLVYFGVRSQCGELAARLSLAFLAIDVTTITYGNLLLSETLFTCLLTVALLLGATSRSRGSAVSCGVVLAAAAYVRPVGLLLAWLWPLVMAVEEAAPGTLGLRDDRPALVALVCLAKTALRGVSVLGDFKDQPPAT
jgi:4-amino-4-deoxy-L-arabinose transferase-like glycosyltransferase